MTTVLWLVILTAGLTAQSLILSDKFFWGLLLYLLGGSAAFWLAYGSRGFGKISAYKPQNRGWNALLLLPALGVICAAGAAWCVWVSTMPGGRPPNYFWAAFGLWLMFLGFGALPALVEAARAAAKQPRRFWLALAGLLAFSFALGLYRLTEVPITVHGDEGMVGLHARQIVEGEIATFFSTSWYTIPQLFYAIPAAALKIFGDSLFGLRMSTVIVGSLTLVPFFITARAFWGGTAAFITGLLMTTNHWYLHLMHCGVNYVQATFFAMTLFCLWHFANERRQPAWCLLAGLVMGLALLSYQANHLLPILWAASQGWLWLLRRIDWKWLAFSSAVPLLLAGFTIAPLYANQSSGQGNMFNARAQGVVILAPNNFNHMNHAYDAEGNAGKIWRLQAQRALLSPIAFEDTSIQYGGTRPLLDRWSAVLFVLAVVMAGHRFFDPRWSTPCWWILGILLTGGMLTVDPPFYPRLAGISALIFLILGGAIAVWLRLAAQNAWIHRFSPTRNATPPINLWLKQTLLFAVMIIFVAASLWINLRYYFVTYANQVSPQSLHYAQTRLGYFLKELGPDYTYLVIPGMHFSAQSGTVKFLAKDYRIQEISQPPSIINDNTVLIVHASRLQELAQLRQRLANRRIQAHTAPNHGPLFYSFHPRE